MKIKKDRIAQISTWSNNCAVSAFAIFLSECIKPTQQSARSTSNKSNSKIIRRLAEMLSDYYKIPKLTDQSVIYLLKKYTLPTDRQIVLGPVLRAFIAKKEGNLETNTIPDTNMLDNNQIKSLAEEFGVGLEFYVDDKNDSEFIQLSDFIPVLEPIGNNKTLRLYYSNNHFNLVCDDEFEATFFNSSLAEVSQHELPIRNDQRKELFETVKKGLTQFSFFSSTLTKLNNVKNTGLAAVKDNIKDLDEEVSELYRLLHEARSDRKRSLRNNKKIHKDNIDSLLDTEDKLIESRLAIPAFILDSQNQNDKDVLSETNVPDTLNLVFREFINGQETPFSFKYEAEDFDSLKTIYMIKHKLARTEFRLNNEYRIAWIYSKKEEYLWKTKNAPDIERTKKEITHINKVFVRLGDFEKTLGKKPQKLTTIERWAINRKSNFIQTFFVKVSNLFSDETAENRAQKKKAAIEEYQTEISELISSLNLEINNETYKNIKEQLLCELNKPEPNSNMLEKKIIEFKRSFESVSREMNLRLKNLLSKDVYPYGLPNWSTKTKIFEQGKKCVNQTDIECETLRIKSTIFNYLAIVSKESMVKIVKKLNPAISLINNLISELKIKADTGSYSSQYEENFAKLKEIVTAADIKNEATKLLEKLPTELIAEFNDNDLINFLIKENYDETVNIELPLDFLLNSLFEEKPINKSVHYPFSSEAKLDNQFSKFPEIDEPVKIEPNQDSQTRKIRGISNV